MLSLQRLSRVQRKLTTGIIVILKDNRSAGVLLKQPVSSVDLWITGLRIVRIDWLRIQAVRVSHRALAEKVNQ